MEEKEKIKEEVKAIINEFMEKLRSIENKIKELEAQDFYLIKRNNLRKEGEEKEVISGKEFKEKWFKVAPDTDENYLLTEKAKWKR
ncbi:MAG TPA: hypothetical protein EYH54_00110 [Nautiliaceae bacterium]|nr:hypothetical protein [Nautiliaceae bacterium]